MAVPCCKGAIGQKCPLRPGGEQIPHPPPMPPGFRFFSGIFRRFPCICPLWASHCPPGDLLPAPGGAGGLYQMYQMDGADFCFARVPASSLSLKTAYYRYVNAGFVPNVPKVPNVPNFRSVPKPAIFTIHSHLRPFSGHFPGSG